MCIILAMTLIISVYIFTFNEDFKEDDISKVVIFGTIFTISILILMIAST